MYHGDSESRELSGAGHFPKLHVPVGTEFTALGQLSIAVLFNDTVLFLPFKQSSMDRLQTVSPICLPALQCCCWCTRRLAKRGRFSVLTDITEHKEERPITFPSGHFLKIL